MTDKNKGRQLTDKQRLFVEAYCGDIKSAAIAAGITHDHGRRLATQSHIKEALSKRKETILGDLIANRAARQRFWTEVMRDKDEAIQNRLKASEILGKSEGDFVERVISETAVKPVYINVKVERD
jgi:phage terminase small subunit